MTPQQKKAHSYAKDRRNTYGECPTSSRKNIARRRAWKHRQYRHAVKQAMGSAVNDDAMQTAARAIRRNGWQKLPDVPLGIVVKRKKARRVATGQQCT
jgi:hypothetical protein